MNTMALVPLLFVFFSQPSDAAVVVKSPSDGQTVSSPAVYSATATTTTCSKGVASMGVYVDDRLVYVVHGTALNTTLPLNSGKHNTVVEEWDYCRGASYIPIDVTVQNAGNVLSNLQASDGWNSWGELAPRYDITSAQGSGVNWSMSQHVNSPSLSGNATRFTIGGAKPYSDVLWSNPVIGQDTTQDVPDTGHTLLPELHNFIYDADFYVTNDSITQVLEFDISMYMNGVGMIWGTQCNNLGGKEWDIWDNAEAKWVPAGAECTVISNEWNHVRILAHREADNAIVYQSITLNGTTANINKTYPPFSVPAGWWGVTLNYQMDGDHKQSANATYLDNFSFTYW